MFSSINQSVLGTFYWIMISQSEFDWVGYKNHWELPINQMKTATLTALFSIHLTCILQITDSDSCVEIMLTRESTVKDVQDTYVVGSQYYSSSMLLFNYHACFSKKINAEYPKLVLQTWYRDSDLKISQTIGGSTEQERPRTFYNCTCDLVDDGRHFFAYCR